MTKQVTVVVEGREYIVEVGDLDASPIQATVGKKTYQVEVPQKQTTTQKSAPLPASPAPAKAAPTPRKASPTPPATGNAITAPMPGDILEVRVQPGDQVNPGDVVCVLEAMKMKNMIRSASGGKVASVEVSPGQAVEYNAILVTFE
jgi:biotin carboxyl carrier protein